MPRFPVDAPIERVIKAFEQLGFRLVRQANLVAMLRENADGSRTPLTMPNHRTLKRSTLRTILTQSQIAPADFLTAYENA